MDLIDAAIKELGYKEGAGNQTKYGEWYGMNGAAWCHMFVSWCADQAGIPLSTVPKTASCYAGEQGYKNHKRWAARGSYSPQRNDLIYFRNGNHVGIVEYVSGGTVHTIEGNTSNAVKRRSYSLTDSSIDGYGKVHDYISNSGTSTASATQTGGSYAGYSGTSGSSKEDGKKRLQYIQSMLKKIESQEPAKADENVYIIKRLSNNSKVSVTVSVRNGKNLFTVPVEDGMKVTWERRSVPGKLEFVTVRSKKYKITEGNPVSLTVNGKGFFYGFVFTSKRTSDNAQTVTVYDQMRYLKNKDSYFYKKKTCDQLLRMIARDFGLNLGKLIRSKYAISRSEDGAELFTIINNAIDETMSNTGTMLILYDEYGKLRLRTPWKVANALIDADTAQEYNYSSSIDSDVYNQIKIVYENKKTGKLDEYVAKSTKTINKWGTLQYYEKTDTPQTAKLQGKIMLKLYNKVARTLSISGAFGNTKVRAGCLIPVMLDLGDITVSNYMLVDKVVHEFSNGLHTMDLDVSGGDFDSESSQ